MVILLVWRAKPAYPRKAVRRGSILFLGATFRALRRLRRASNATPNLCTRARALRCEWMPGGAISYASRFPRRLDAASSILTGI